MKIGPLEITTTAEAKRADAATQQRIKKIEDKMAKEVKAIHDEVIQRAQEADAKQTVKRSYSITDLPYANIYKDKKLNGEEESYTSPYDLLRFWSKELPQSPQTIKFIQNSVFARKFTLQLNTGKKDNEKLYNKILAFIRKPNQNNTNLIAMLKTFLKDGIVLGNGYMEVTSKSGSKSGELAELNLVRPQNMIVLVDEEKAKSGVLAITGYAKVKDAHTKDIKISDEDKKKIAENKIDPANIIHYKHNDEGLAYGISDFENNQEITKMIMNVLNRNQKKFTNDIRHSIHVQLGPDANEIDANLFLAQYRANYLGKQNFGKPLITYGDIKVEFHDLEDAEFDYAGFYNDIAVNHSPSLMGVSPSEIINNDAKYANAEQGHITTILNTIYNYQDVIETIVNDRIIRALEGLKLDTEEEATYRFVLGRENVFTMYSQINGLNRALLSGGITPNEYRNILDPQNLPEIEDDWANQFYVLTGQEVRVINEEFFAGGDGDDEDGEQKSITDGDSTLLVLGKKKSKKK